MAQSITDPRLLDRDGFYGTTEWFHYDQDTGGFTVETVQDVTPILELSKAMYNNAPLRFGDLTHVKHIPAVMMMWLAKQGIVAPGGAILDEKRFRAWLNERDTAAFRTHPGRL